MLTPKEEITVEFICIEDFFIKTFKYLDDLKFLLSKIEKIDIAIKLFEKIGQSSYVKSLRYSFVVELYERYETQNEYGV